MESIDRRGARHGLEFHAIAKADTVCGEGKRGFARLDVLKTAFRSLKPGAERAPPRYIQFAERRLFLFARCTNRNPLAWSRARTCARVFVYVCIRERERDGMERARARLEDESDLRVPARRQDPRRGRQQPGEVGTWQSRGWGPRQCPTPGSGIDLSQRKSRYRPESISWMDKPELLFRLPSFASSLLSLSLYWSRILSRMREIFLFFFFFLVLGLSQMWSRGALWNKLWYFLSLFFLNHCLR